MAVHPGLTGNSVARIKRLLAALATSVPFTPDLAKLKRTLEFADDRTLKTYLGYLEDAGLIMALRKQAGGLKALDKPEKIYLGDPNQIYALQGRTQPDIGNLRETFFLRMVSSRYPVRAARKGDFLVAEQTVFEVGGRSKTAEQIRGEDQAYLALDEIETGVGRRIPLWLFGFLH